MGSWLAVPLAMACAGCQEGTSLDVSLARPVSVLEVDVVPVVKTRIESSIELTGTLFPWKFATIASEVTGVIESIPESGEKLDYEINGQTYSKVLPLDIGHQVKKGDVLVKIESSESQHALRLAEAKQVATEKELANLYAWKRSEEIAQLQAQCDECEAVLVDAQADLMRAQTLLGRNAISKKEVEDAQRSVATAMAARSRARGCTGTGAGRTDAGADCRRPGTTGDGEGRSRIETQDMVDKCTIRCPLETACIVERYVGVGDHVTANPSTPLMRMVDSSLLLAQVNVPERYQGLIKLRDRATLTAEGGHAAELQTGDVAAMVVLVNAQVDPETRTFRVRVGIDNSENLFKAGTFVKVRIPITVAQDTVVVPVNAISFAKGEPAVFVVEDGVVEKRPVELGISNRTHYQILSGLDESEQIVRGSLSLLATGLRVQPKANTPQDTASAATRSQG